MKKNRNERLNGELQKNIYEIISTEVKDEDLTEMISIFGVDVTPDLKHAKVYISVYSKDEEKKAKTFNAVVRAAGFIRRQLGGMMRTYTVPELHFVLDNSLDYSEKINRIIDTFK